MIFFVMVFFCWCIQKVFKPRRYNECTRTIIRRIIFFLVAEMELSIIEFIPLSQANVCDYREDLRLVFFVNKQIHIVGRVS